MISFTCASCHKTCQTDDVFAGKSSVCPACGAPVVVPAAAVPPFQALGDEERACPACGERIKKVASICRFCKTRFDAPVDLGGVPAAPARKSRTLLWVLLGIFGVVGLLCVGGIVVMMVKGKEMAGWAFQMACTENLKQLHAGLREEEAESGALPDKKGGGFWTEIAGKRNKRLHLLCQAPVLRGRQTAEAYRGPAKPWRELKDEDAVACCPVDSHPEGIVVLFKNGKIEFVSKTDPRYERALQTTED